MKYTHPEARQVHIGAGGPSSPAIYVIDLPEFPFDLSGIAGGRESSIVILPIENWDDALTPWPAKGLYRGDADFKGEAALTLEELRDEAIPLIERGGGITPNRRATCGYSLGGLFSLYAFTRGASFDACACLSGSVWYEGWLDHLRGLEFDGAGRFAFLSIGSKEKRASPPILHCVQDNMEQCAEILRARGCQVEYVVGPGNHMQFHRERFEAGLSALDAFLARP